MRHELNFEVSLAYPAGGILVPEERPRDLGTYAEVNGEAVAEAVDAQDSDSVPVEDKCADHSSSCNLGEMS